MKLRYVISLLFFLLLNVDAAWSEIIRPTSFDDRVSCEKSSGIWRQFGNGCANECYAKFDEFSVCTDAIISACDCGKGRCWNQNHCVSLSDYKKIYDDKRRADDELRNKNKEERADKFRRNRQRIASNLFKSSQSNQRSAKKDDDGFFATAFDDSSAKPVSQNNLNQFQNKQRMSSTQQMQPEVKSANASGMIDDVNSNLEKGDKMLSLFLSDAEKNKKNKKGANLAITKANSNASSQATVPPVFLQNEKKEQEAAATQQDQSQQDPNMIVNPTKVGQKDANKQLISNKSLIQQDDMATHDDNALPQLPMP